MEKEPIRATYLQGSIGLFIGVVIIRNLKLRRETFPNLTVGSTWGMIEGVLVAPKKTRSDRCSADSSLGVKVIWVLVKGFYF